MAAGDGGLGRPGGPNGGRHRARDSRGRDRSRPCRGSASTGPGAMSAKTKKSRWNFDLAMYLRPLLFGRKHGEPGDFVAMAGRTRRQDCLLLTCCLRDRLSGEVARMIRGPATFAATGEHAEQPASVRSRSAARRHRAKRWPRRTHGGGVELDKVGDAAERGPRLLLARLVLAGAGRNSPSRARRQAAGPRRQMCCHVRGRRWVPARRRTSRSAEASGRGDPS